MNTTRALVFVVLSLAAASAAAQPVLRYTFDEPSGNALDTGAGPATDAALVDGATRSTDTPSGSGMSLDLRTDNPIAYAAAPDTAEFDGFTALTLSTWLKIEAYPSNPSNNKRLVAKQAADATFSGFSFNLNAAPNNGNPAAPDNFRLGLFVGSADAFDFAFSDADAGAAAWTFIAATYDSAVGEIKFYTGGVSTPVTQLGSTLFTALNPTPLDSNAQFAVGLTDAAPTADTSVTGWQDDVRVYSSALDLAALEAVRMENLQGGGGFDAGDFNEDNKVDGADLAAWAGGFGTTGTATHQQGDADGDMDADGADFLVWQQEQGAGVAGATSVPEPAACLLAAAAALAGATRRRR
jgi:hypothetical protein